VYVLILHGGARIGKQFWRGVLMRRLSLSVSMLCAVCVLGSHAFAQQAQPPAAPPPPYGAPITSDQAKAAAAAAIAEAKKNNWFYAVAVVEPTGDLIYFERMDNTQYASIKIAQARARSAALFRRATKAFSDRVSQKNDLSVLSLADANWSEGGVPIVVNGKLIGAIGASGGTQPQDGQVAQARADAVK
jgi:glc operon protein GlcG